MIICPKCGKLAALNMYFGVYHCLSCSWKKPSEQGTQMKNISTYRDNLNKSNDTRK